MARLKPGFSFETSHTSDTSEPGPWSKVINHHGLHILSILRIFGNAKVNNDAFKS
jgi:hypothetical protein